MKMWLSCTFYDIMAAYEFIEFSSVAIFWANNEKNVFFVANFNRISAEFCPGNLRLMSWSVYIGKDRKFLLFFLNFNLLVEGAFCQCWQQRMSSFIFSIFVLFSFVE